MTFTREKWERYLSKSPPAFAAEARAAARVGEAEVTLAPEVFEALRRKHLCGSRLSAPPARGLGDLVESAAKPIARALRLDCLDAQGNLKPESRCGQRKAWLNRFGEKVEKLFNMNTPNARERLVERQTALRTRVQQSADAVILARARLASLEQRHSGALGELKAISEVLADTSGTPEPAPSTSAAPGAAAGP